MDTNDIVNRSEQIAKVSASLALAVYIVGYLVTALYYSTLGIAPINPLRTRVASAGLLFVFTLGIGYWAGRQSLYEIMEPQSQSDLDKIDVLSDWGLLVLICSLFRLILWEMTDFNKNGLAKTAGLYLLSIALYMVGRVIWEQRAITIRVRRTITAAIMLLAMGMFVLFSFWPRSSQSSSFLFGWLVLVASSTIGKKVLIRSGKFSAATYITSLIAEAILLVTLFSHLLFPHFLPEWGGGAPVPVVLTYNKEAGYLAGQVKPALLLDEGELGFYLIDRGLKRAYFIPRSEIALVAYRQQTDQSAESGR